MRPHDIRDSYLLARRVIPGRAVRLPLGSHIRHFHRSKSTQSPRTESSIKAATATLSPKWLSDVKQRIGHCIKFGLATHQADEAAKILQEMARDWRELVAGSEGYLTGADRRGLFRQEVVWGEMDSMPIQGYHISAQRVDSNSDTNIGHVNNVVYNRYAESARIIWAQQYARHIDPEHAEAWKGLWTPKGIGLILRSIKTDFKFPMTFPDHVTVYHKLGSEPSENSNAFTLDVLILSELHQRSAARCEEDIVVYDYKTGKKTPLQPFMAKCFRETWRLQEQAKQQNSERVNGILNRVRELEMASWDNPNAVEDMGSAKP